MTFFDLTVDETPEASKRLLALLNEGQGLVALLQDALFFAQYRSTNEQCLDAIYKLSEGLKEIHNDTEQ